MTVPHELVHKRALGEVLVTSVAADEQGWIVKAALPQDHSFHNDTTGRQSGYHDPLLLLEAFRQGCIAAGHLLYAVPLGFHYTVRRYGFTVLDLAAFELTTEPAQFEIRIGVRREFRHADQGSVQGLDVAGTLRRNGLTAMDVSTSFGWMPEARWQLMRTGSQWETLPQPRATDPWRVGRRHPHHVVIGEPAHHHDGSVYAPIVVDTHNSTFFDHPLDHLPGGLILEACRQLAVAVLGARAATTVGPARLHCDFHSFAELNPSCVVALSPASDAASDALTFGAEVTQSGRPRATVELAFDAQDSAK